MFTSGQQVVLVRAGGREMTRQTVTEVADGVATVAGMPFDVTTGLHLRSSSVWVEPENPGNLAACEAQVAVQSAEASMVTLLKATPEQLGAIAAELAAAVAALP